MLSDKSLALFSTFEAALGVVLMNNEGPVSKRHQTTTHSQQRKNSHPEFTPDGLMQSRWSLTFGAVDGRRLHHLPR